MSPPSDKKLKENIKDTDINALDIINQIQFRQFDWNDSYKKLGFSKYEKHVDFGVVADELGKINSDFVLNTQQNDGTILKTVNRDELIYYNSKSIQEIFIKLIELKNELEEMKNGKTY